MLVRETDDLDGEDNDSSVSASAGMLFKDWPAQSISSEC